MIRLLVILGFLGYVLVFIGVGEGRGIRQGRSLRPRATKNVCLLMFAIILFA